MLVKKHTHTPTPMLKKVLAAHPGPTLRIISVTALSSN